LTRVDEVKAVTCKIEQLASGRGSRIVADLDASYASKWDDDEYAVDIGALEKLKNQYVLISAATTVRPSVVGGKFIHRRWGPFEKGVAVDLTLDKGVYELGSDIPMHIAMANFFTAVPITDPDPLYDPPGVTVELRDARGTLITPGAGVVWMGHGSCRRYVPGLVIRDELTLSQMGFRVDHPGEYTVVAIWRPSSTTAGNCGISSAPPYITVRSAPARFRVVAKQNP
jgi:hypothetical protein